jgi:hypothetical protein
MINRKIRTPFEDTTDHGTFTHQGQRYDLGRLVARIARRNVEVISISRLVAMWQHFPLPACGSCKNGPADWHEQRIALADLNQPVLVYFEHNLPMLLDGQHRLEKALRLKGQVLPFIRIWDEDLRNTLIPRETLADQPPIILDADKCNHDHFQIECTVDRIEDVDPITFYANIRIRCTECETPFHFIGLPYGLAPTEPRLEVGGLECRMPIGPGQLPIGNFGEARYELGRRRK